jgi:hypothetical protein
MKKGKEYEILVEKLYSRIIPGSTIKRNDKIYGHNSKKNREIDLSIRQSIGPHKVLMIVQVRDKKRTVDVNAIGELSSVVEDVRANKGIMISAKGFTHGALEMAKAKNIDALTAHDLDNPKWTIDVRMPVILDVCTGNVSQSFVLVASEEYALHANKLAKEGKRFSAPPLHLFRISQDGGKTFKTIQETSYEILSHIEDDKMFDGQEHKAEYKGENEILLQVAENVTTPLRDVVFKFKAIKKSYYKYFKVEEFKGLIDRSTNFVTRVNVRVVSEEFEVNNFDIIDKEGLDLSTWMEYHESVNLIHPYKIRVSQITMGFPKPPVKWKILHKPSSL